jgi:hypothetical protein
MQVGVEVQYLELELHQQTKEVEALVEEEMAA